MTERQEGRLQVVPPASFASNVRKRALYERASPPDVKPAEAGFTSRTFRLSDADQGSVR